MLVLLAVFAAVESAQQAADSAGIIRAALDVAESWYTGGADQTEQALHPELAKRIIRTDGRGRSRLDHMSAMTLVQAVRQGWGKQIPPERHMKNVSILTIFGTIAAVRVEMDKWVDLMHIGKYGGEWKIVNVLWDVRPGVR